MKNVYSLLPVKERQKEAKMAHFLKKEHTFTVSCREKIKEAEKGPDFFKRT